MAEWRKRRLKIKRVLGLLKDQVGKGLAFATSSFAGIHVGVVMATSHEEVLPDEKHVQSILAATTGSRVRVAYCTRVLVKRLSKTRNWAVALKCLILIHRTLQDGGFLFQDQFSFLASGGRGYLNFSSFRDDSGPLAWALSSWVRRYARFVDERLICNKMMGCFYDSIGQRAPFMASEELLEDIYTLQALMQQVFECEADGIASENEIVLGSLRLVVRDSYSVQEELRCRFREMRERVGDLQLAQALQFVQVARKACEQTEKLLEFYELCEACGISEACEPPNKIEISDLELKQVREAIKGASTHHSLISLVRAGSMGRSPGRFSFSISSKPAPTLRRSLSSSSSPQLGSPAAWEQKLASTNLSSTPPDGLSKTSNACEEDQGVFNVFTTNFKPAFPLHGYQPQLLNWSNLSVVDLFPPDWREHRTGAMTLTFPTQTQALSFPAGPVPQAAAAESTAADWEKTLMDSISFPVHRST